MARCRTSLIALIAASLLTAPAEAAQKRDPKVRAAFMLLHPCPATGKTRGRCDGWQVDHRLPICFYGPDVVWNLQWLTIQDHREKTKLDVKVCDWDGLRGNRPISAR